MKQVGNKKPYTKKQIVKEKCYRCGRPAKFQWSICANNNLYVAVCEECDYGLNSTVLNFMKFPKRMTEQLLKRYAKTLELL